MQNSRWWNAILGGISGFALVAGVSQFWLNAGTSLPAQTALLATLLAALIAQAVMPTRWRNGLLSQSARLFVLSAGTVVLPSLFELSWKLIGTTSVDLSNSLTAQCVGLTVMALATLGLPMFCTLGLSSSGRQTVFGVSLALAIGIGGIGLATFIGPDGCGLFAAASGLVSFLAAMIAWARDGKLAQRAGDGIVSSADPRLPCHPCAVQGVNGIERTRISRMTRMLRKTPSLVIGQILTAARALRASSLALMAVGVLWVIGQRLVRQLVPDSFALMAVEWGTLVAGVALGRWLAREDRRGGLVACGLGLSCWTWLCLALFPLGVRLALWENATISQVWLLQSLRLAMVGLVLVPIGVSAGVLIGRNGSVVHIVFALISAMVASWLLPAVGVWSFALMATSVLLGIAVWSGIRISNFKFQSPQ